MRCQEMGLVPNPARSAQRGERQDVSNLAGGALTPQSLQCPGHACRVNGTRDGFPPGEEFEGSGRCAEDKPEREKSRGKIPPSAHEPYKSLKRFKLVDEFAIVKLTLPLAKSSMPSATSNRSKTEGAWQLAGNLKMPGNGN